MLLCNALGIMEAEARSFDIATVQPFEGLKDLLRVLRIEAGAIIANKKDPIFPPSRIDNERTRREPELQRVLKQVLINDAQKGSGCFGLHSVLNSEVDRF